MDNEPANRHQTAKLRLAGRFVEDIDQITNRLRDWYHIWWCHYRLFDPNGLFDLTRSNMRPRRISAELERSIVKIRQKLASRAHPGKCYSLIMASAILAELRILHIRPLPCVWDIERVLERSGETVLKVRLASYLARSTYSSRKLSTLISYTKSMLSPNLSQEQPPT